MANEAIKIAEALKPMFKAWFDEWNKPDVRRKKVEVVTPPHTNSAGENVITVQEAFGNPFDVPYSSQLSGATQGQSVFVEYSHDASNMIAVPIIPTGGSSEDFLPLSGGTLTGTLILAADQTMSFGAATKRYVDDIGVSANQYADTVGNGKLALSGGTMTGAVVLHGDPTQNLHPATKRYVDNHSSGAAYTQTANGWNIKIGNLMIQRRNLTHASGNWTS